VAFERRFAFVFPKESNGKKNRAYRMLDQTTDNPVRFVMER